MDFLRRTWAEIDLDALIHNLKIANSPNIGCKTMAVVKANAYGHNVEFIAPALDNAGADAFAVSNIEEAVQLREIGITKPILILSYTPVDLVDVIFRHNISQCVYCSDYAAALSEAAVKKGICIKVHIKLDTGMSRIGFDCRSGSLCGIEDAICAATLPGFEIEGIFTHFAYSDRTPEGDDGFTNEQFSKFIAATKRFEANGIHPPIYHCCNSAACLLDRDKHLQYTRPGIILYGLTPNSDLELGGTLIPVMTLKSVISMVKTISPGDTVSYGRTYKAATQRRIATISAGYADGYPRLLSNKGFVLINGKKAPIVGRVCMDQMTVDVTDIGDVSIGQEVILFGKDLPVDELAQIVGTINYEMVCNISHRVPRIIKNKH